MGNGASTVAPDKEGNSQEIDALNTLVAQYVQWKNAPAAEFNAHMMVAYRDAITKLNLSGPSGRFSFSAGSRRVSGPQVFFAYFVVATGL